MKTCLKCRQSLPLVEFHVARARSDGRHVWCKPCMREYAKLRARDKRAVARTSALACETA